MLRRSRKRPGRKLTERNGSSLPLSRSLSMAKSVTGMEAEEEVPVVSLLADSQSVVELEQEIKTTLVIKSKNPLW